MKVYLVGGSVRDKLLGHPPKDNDFLVVDVTHDEMIKLGYEAVGKEHTVYLHPGTKDEYSISKDLYSDLERRDLTINAMAMNGEEVIDYFNGRIDLQDKVLKHVKEENIFHDPIRVYRIARFASQLPPFSIHPETLELMKKVATTEKFKNLDPERIFSEFKKALLAPSPDVFFFVLKEVKAMPVHFKEIMKADEKFLKDISRNNSDPVIRFASLFIHSSANEVKDFSERLKIPNDWEKAAEVITESRSLRERSGKKEILDFLYKIDAFRRPYHLEILRHVLAKKAETIIRAYDLTKSISINDIEAGISGKDAGLAIKEKRLSVLQDFLH